MERDELLQAYRATRTLSVELCRPLRPEDYRIQSMPDVSPPWWNLGHTSWFFAKNLLEPWGRALPSDRRLDYALNSYYEALGPRLARDQRGHQTRPTTAEIYDFRASVDHRIEQLLGEVPPADYPRFAFLLTTGIQHEQQHQELLLTEIKHILGSNLPELREPYRASADPPAGGAARAAGFTAFEAGVFPFGNVEGGWCWDNEMPVHRAFLEGFAVANRLVTNAEYLEFMADGGYADPLLWLANGWAKACEAGWQAPLYWERDGSGWRQWTLGGESAIALKEPVCHVSFYEADAYARWRASRGGDSGVRLPAEREWEHAARSVGFPVPGGNLLDSGALRPRAANGAAPIAQLAGDVWEWTTNHYEPYPGYVPFDGNLMEYNGKFMDNQRVLRGGSCVTPAAHIRASYRNFWPADTRFQFTGIRLARSA